MLTPLLLNHCMICEIYDLSTCSVAICLNASNLLCVIFGCAWFKSGWWDTLSGKCYHHGVDALLHIVHFNFMTSGYCICVCSPDGFTLHEGRGDDDVKSSYFGMGLLEMCIEDQLWSMRWGLAHGRALSLWLLMLWCKPSSQHPHMCAHADLIVIFGGQIWPMRPKILQFT